MSELKKPVDWDELYPGRFLKAGLFKGAKPTLTIKSVDLDELEGTKGKETKGILSFEERPLQLALNKTNGLCLRAMFGKHLPDWIGKRVTLFATKHGADDCIRVWGSPDIPADTDVVVQLTRKAPFNMTMHKTADKKPRQSTEREPGEEG